MYFGWGDLKKYNWNIFKYKYTLPLLNKKGYESWYAYIVLACNLTSTLTHWSAKPLR